MRRDKEEVKGKGRLTVYSRIILWVQPRVKDNSVGSSMILSSYTFVSSWHRMVLCYQSFSFHIPFPFVGIINLHYSLRPWAPFLLSFFWAQDQLLGCYRQARTLLSLVLCPGSWCLRLLCHYLFMYLIF